MLHSSLPTKLLAAGLSLFSASDRIESGNAVVASAPPATRVEEPNIRCAETRSTSVAIPFVTHPRGAMIPLLSRRLDLVRVPGQLLADNPVLFDQHFRLVP